MVLVDREVVWGGPGQRDISSAERRRLKPLLGFATMFHTDDDFSFGVSFGNIPERFRNIT